MPEKILLVDGHSIINRAFHAIPDMTDSRGRHTNAIFGFFNIFLKVADEERPDYLAVAFDLPAPTFRHKMYDGYKAARKPMAPELKAQVPLCKELVTACGIPIFEMEGYEADDILGTLATKAEAEGMDAVILSGDRDMLQLASKKICVRLPVTRGGMRMTENYYAEDVMEKYGVTPEGFVYMKALMGDKSDNIPGVPGIGEKAAPALVSQYHDIDGIYANLENITPARVKNALSGHEDAARLSYDLALICRKVPVDADFEKARIGSLYTPKAYEIMKGLELKTLISRFEKNVENSGSCGPQKQALDLNIKRYDCASFERCINSMCSNITSRLNSGARAIVGIQAVVAGDICFGLAIYFEKDGAFIPLNDDKQGQLTLPVPGVTNGPFADPGFLKNCVDKIIACAPNGDSSKSIFERKLVIASLDLKRTLKLVPLEDSGIFFDASLAAYLVNPLKSTYSWDDIARDYLGKVAPSYKELVGKAKPHEILEGVVDLIAAYSAAIPPMAAPVLMEKLKEIDADGLFENMEMPVLFSLNGMELAGIRVDRGALREYGQTMERRIFVLEREIFELTGEEFNINSPKQLGEMLYDKMGLPHIKKTKSGYSTAADVLEKLAPFEPVAGKILEYRACAKLKSTYADGLAAYIGNDGRIHGIFKQTVTATGRISSAEPNLQNIPVRTAEGREIRKMFVPDDGFLFVDADYSQIELRILAALSGDRALIDAYRHAADIHAVTASRVFHVPLEEVTPELRGRAKAVNFGIVYGISSFGLSEGLLIGRKEAAEYIQNYFRTYPKVKEYLDSLVENAKRDGYVTTYFKRRRPIPEIKSTNFNTRSFGERAAMNSPIQGTAADIMKIAMINVDAALKREGLRARIVLQVHDELLVEALEDEAARVCEILKSEMEGAADLAVPLVAEVHTGRTWMEAKG